MSLIVVDVAVNKGKPSVATLEGRHETVRSIASFINGGVTVEETMEELHLDRVTVETAMAYAAKYPEILK